MFGQGLEFAGGPHPRAFEVEVGDAGDHDGEGLFGCVVQITCADGGFWSKGVVPVEWVECIEGGLLQRGVWLVDDDAAVLCVAEVGELQSVFFDLGKLRAELTALLLGSTGAEECEEEEERDPGHGA